MERNLDTEVAILINDLDNVRLRIEGLQAHPRYTDALNSVTAAKTALTDGRIHIHQQEMRARFAKMDAA